MKKELKNLETSSSNINKTDPKKAIIGLVSTTALSVYMGIEMENDMNIIEFVVVLTSMGVSMNLAAKNLG